MEKKDNLSLYRETFLKKTHYTARDGKQVYIPVVYHEKMLKIVQLICSNRVNISDLLCNIVRCQIKVHNCKCSYLCCNIILLFSEILLLIEFCFIVSLILLISSPCPKYTSLGVRLSNDS